MCNALISLQGTLCKRERASLASDVSTLPIPQQVAHIGGRQKGLIRLDLVSAQRLVTQPSIAWQAPHFLGIFPMHACRAGAARHPFL